MPAKTTTIRTLYVHVVLNGVIFPQILYDIVPYARKFLPVKYFPKYIFNTLSFQRPQLRVLARGVRWGKIGLSHL